VKALVTGFDPFGGAPVNASLEAVRRLPRRAGAIEIETAELPTSFARAPAALERELGRVHPDFVLLVGEAGEREALCLERVALNVRDASIPDNDGERPRGLPVVEGGPPAYFSTLPARPALAALRSAGLPAELSYHAGTFVCNHVFYALLHLAATRGLALRGGLLHLPAARSARLRPEEAARAIEIVLEAAAAGTLA
jgi:pyroglutamyl-peptidase